MSKVRIVYATKTKHSRKLAQAVGKALGTTPENVADNLTNVEADLLFIVGGIYGSQSLPELLSFVEDLDKEKIGQVALVTSCASGKQGQDSVRKILEEKGIPIVDEYICLGSFLIMKMGHPNQEETQKAVDFALRIAEGAVA
jgi:flavodoxin